MTSKNANSCCYIISKYKQKCVNKRGRNHAKYKEAHAYIRTYVARKDLEFVHGLVIQ